MRQSVLSDTQEISDSVWKIERSRANNSLKTK